MRIITNFKMCVMKLNKYFMMGAMGLSLVACSDNLDENGQGANGTNPNEGTTYVAFTLDFKGAESRAEDTSTAPDTEVESKVTTAYVMVANNGTISKVISNSTTGAEEGSDGSKYDATSDKYLLKVPAGSNDFYAVVNPDGEAPQAGQTISEYFNTAVTLSLANVVKENNFMMASESVTTENVRDNVTEEQALNEGINNFEITVERVSAKVTVTCADAEIKGNYEGTVGGTLDKNNTKFKLKGIPNMAYRMGQTSIVDIVNENLNYTTFYINPNSIAITDEEKAEIPVYFPEESIEENQHRNATPAYCLENLHETYYQHITTYINLKTKFMPDKVVDCDSQNEDGAIKDVTLETPVSFYVVNSGALQDNYILKSDLDAYRSTNGEDALPNGVESISDLHEDGWCYFNNIWVGQPQLGQSAEGPIERNTWYNLAITGITFPGDSEEKDPDPIPDPGEELPLEPLTNVALTITVPDWNFKSNSLVLGE